METERIERRSRVSPTHNNCRLELEYPSEGKEARRITLHCHEHHGPRAFASDKRAVS
jgi:hypothetical protein